MSLWAQAQCKQEVRAQAQCEQEVLLMLCRLTPPRDPGGTARPWNQVSNRALACCPTLNCSGPSCSSTRLCPAGHPWSRHQASALILTPVISQTPQDTGHLQPKLVAKSPHPSTGPLGSVLLAPGITLGSFMQSHLIPMKALQSDLIVTKLSS